MCDTMPPRRSIGADRVQGGVSTAPPHVSMRNPSRTPLAFSGVDMMPVFSATKDRYVALSTHVRSGGAIGAQRARTGELQFPSRGATAFLETH